AGSCGPPSREDGKAGGARQELVEEPKLFAFNLVGQENDTGEIPARPIEARNKTSFDRVERGGEDDRYRAGQGFGDACRVSTVSGTHGHSPTHEISRQFRQPALVILGPF